MAERRARSRAKDGLLATYRRIRKPMPPPEKVIRDRRRELDRDNARREMEER